MGKISRISKSNEFSAIDLASKQIGENNDCSVKAVALIANVSYEHAHQMMKNFGRKRNCGVLSSSVNRAVTQITGKRLVWTFQSQFIRMYPGNHKNLKHMTTYHPVRFSKVFESIKGRYLIFTANHVLTMIDGVVHDWSNDKALRVTSIYKLED